VHHDDRHRVASVCLPIALAQDWNSRLYRDQSSLGGTQCKLPTMKESGESLHMSTAQKSPRPELQSRCIYVLVWLLHKAILNGK
jgi:hypothetical protein